MGTNLKKIDREARQRCFFSDRELKNENDSLQTSELGKC